MIDRRKEQRYPAKVRTQILYKGQVYGGVIENLSASGAGIVTDQLDKKVDFAQYDSIELKFRSPSGEEFHINCTIMWASYISPSNASCRIGLELVDRPWDAIRQFIK